MGCWPPIYTLHTIYRSIWLYFIIMSNDFIGKPILKYLAEQNETLLMSIHYVEGKKTYLLTMISFNETSYYDISWQIREQKMLRRSGVPIVRPLLSEENATQSVTTNALHLGSWVCRSVLNIFSVECWLSKSEDKDSSTLDQNVSNKGG